MSDADRARKQEIERKKAQLRAIREKKAKEQAKARQQQGQGQQQHSTPPPAPGQATKEKEDINDLVSSLLAGRAGPQSPPQASPPAPTGNAAPATSEASAPHPPPSSQVPSTKERLARLSICKAVDWHVEAREPVVYERGTQTDTKADGGEEDAAPRADADGEFDAGGDGEGGSGDEAVVDPEETTIVPPVGMALAPEEIEAAQESPEYSEFVSRSVSVVERCLTLNSRYDFMVDYTTTAAGEDDTTTEHVALKLEATMFDSTMLSAKTSTCTALDWSWHHPELLAAGYGSGGHADKDGGSVMLWNIHVPQRPEMHFKAPSAVTGVQLCPFHPNLVVAGTYSGQVVLWDTRAKATPVQRTPLGAVSHTHPVYALAFVGTQHAHNLITASTDGRLCTWSLDMLAKAQDSMLLQHKQTKAVSVSCMSFADADTNNFVVGSEDGAIYTGCRHGGKAGVQDAYRAHHGPVTAVHHRTGVPGAALSDMADVFLSSAADWTVNLWSSKVKSPLYTFDNSNNYVYDVAWSPRHPAAFAYVHENRLSLVDLTADLEAPVTEVEVHTESRAAVNRLRWSREGNAIACGDARGGVHLYSVGEAYARPPNVGEVAATTAAVVQDLKMHKQ